MNPSTNTKQRRIGFERIAAPPAPKLTLIKPAHVSRYRILIKKTEHLTQEELARKGHAGFVWADTGVIIEAASGQLARELYRHEHNIDKVVPLRADRTSFRLQRGTHSVVNMRAWKVVSVIWGDFESGVTDGLRHWENARLQSACGRKFSNIAIHATGKPTCTACLKAVSDAGLRPSTD